MSVADNEEAEFWKKAHEDTCVLLAKAKEERNAAIERAEKAEKEQKRWESVAEKAWEQAHRIGDNLFEANLLAMENETRIKTLEVVVDRTARQFELYELSHRAKETDDGNAKADTNARMAQMCRAALPTTDAQLQQSNDDHQKDQPE